MQELSLEKAKEIVIEAVPELDFKLAHFMGEGYISKMFKFSRILMAAEVYHVDDIETIQKNSHDLLHFSGIHKIRFDVAKAGALRFFWSQLWESQALKQYPDLKEYIEDVCEASVYKAGKSRRSYGLLLSSEGARRPWRTDEWYAARAPKKIPYQKLTEFYPYISVTPTEDHELLLAVDRIVPKGLNPDTRADVCQDMIVAILSGEVSLENMAGERPKYMKQFFKMFPAKYGHLSLDMPIFEDSKKTLGETIAAEYR